MSDVDDADDGECSLFGKLVEVVKAGDTRGCSGTAVGYKDGAYLVARKERCGRAKGTHVLLRRELEVAEKEAGTAGE